ncbi:MAG: metallophosphoesterase [Micropruina sp.]
MNRLVSTKSDASLLSQFSSEISSAASYGFTSNEGVALKAAPSSGVDLVGVWRLYNSKTSDFTWAAEGTDLTRLQAQGYSPQFRQFYAATVSNDCVSTAYRLAKGDKTRVAVGATARDALIADDWTVASSGMFYAVPGETPPSDSEPDAPAGNAEEFTVAVIPDTQQETWTDADTRFRNRSQWLVDNSAGYNLKFATHIGDVVNWGNVAPAQFTRAKNGLAPLNGKIPYSLTIGNHDTGAVCAGGSACPGVSASVSVRDTTAFNAAFKASDFADVRGAYEAGKVDNTYSTFTAGGEKWMVLNLELWPRQGAIDWAKRVVASNADHNVIVSTHSYLEADGSIGTSNGGYGATSPKYLFDNLIKVYPNIRVVVSGHVGGGASRVDTGVNGNKILSLLQCYHSRTTNPVRMLKFDVAKGTITNWVYAPYTKETISAQSTTSGFDFDQ